MSGQSDFLSAPLPGTGGSARGGAASDGAGAPPAAVGGTTSAGHESVTQRTVEETDLYRLDGDRLYYLNAYRGLMVFDVADVDHPKLLGRSPIFGDPQEMLVRNGVAVVVVGDWYGQMENGTPFHGSIVRGLDCTDPTHIKVVGEALLGGWVRDTRVVGDVLYTVAEDYGWQYGWEYGWGGYYYGGGVGGGAVDGVATPSAGGGATGVSSGGTTATGPKVAVASVSFAGGVVRKVDEKAFDGQGGIFNVTPAAIMLAHQEVQQPPYTNTAGKTDIQYVDITDPGGLIKLRGQIAVNGAVSGWGPDNGRWNLDFQDNIHAHAFGCAQTYCGSASNDSYILSTVDFTNPDAPALSSEMAVAGLGWSAAARFDLGRMYLSPSDNYYSSSSGTTPLSIYDLSNAAAPKLAGKTDLVGNIWMFIPNGDHVFSIGNSYSPSGPYGYDASQVTVQYVDASDATAPRVLGSSSFGQGWAWTPAAGTFKAFTVDATKGLAVVPFSGWDPTGQHYENGVQLLQFTSSTLTGGGAAHTKGWVERGIFVKTRLVSLSDQALSVVDYTNPATPRVVTEMTLARNVVNAQPQGATIAELSSDWWGNDSTKSEMRVLPIANAEETTDNGQGTSVSIDGVDATLFQNGTLSYVVTSVQSQGSCNYPYGAPGGSGTCPQWTQQIQIVDTANGGATLRGKVALPSLPSYYGGWGWYGFWYYDWFDGSNAVQVNGDTLAFRRWLPQYAYSNGGYQYVDSLDALFVVDLSNADAPAVASLTITSDTTGWWGNMKAVGSKLYTTHYEWVDRPDPNGGQSISHVRYYLDEVDLTDRAHPRVGQKINVPGVLVGASDKDPSLLYFADYRWDSNNPRNDVAVCRLSNGKAYLQSVTSIDGWVGNVIVKGEKAYTTSQQYEWALPAGQTPTMALHQLDLSNPQAPVDRVSTDKASGWGWLLDVEGDRAVVTSGWGPVGVDIYKLSDTAAPAFDKSVRTRGWWTSSIKRQDSSLYLTSGYWGVQRVDLQ